MSTEKQAIAEALKQLDPTNDTHWTDDGSPMISEVQRLCNDNEITRADINDAIPGYDRKVASFRRGLRNAPPPETAKPETVASDDLLSNAAPESDELSVERTREILKRRVADAETNLSDKKLDAAEANREVGRAEQRLARAMTDLQRKFPPISPEEAIKQHLAKQQELARERAALTGFGSDIDRQKALTRRGVHIRGSTVAA